MRTHACTSTHTSTNTPRRLTTDKDRLITDIVVAGIGPCAEMIGRIGVSIFTSAKTPEKVQQTPVGPSMLKGGVSASTGWSTDEKRRARKANDDLVRTYIEVPLPPPPRSPLCLLR